MIIKLANLPRTTKSLIILASDFVLLPLILWASIALRLDDWVYPSRFSWWFFVLPSLIATPIFIRFGLYRAVIRYIEDRAVVTIAAAVSLATLLLVAAFLFLKISGVPRGAILIFWLLALMVIITSRFVARSLLRQLAPFDAHRKSVLIYGAGSAGRQLAVALRTGQDYQPIGFVDDSVEQQGLQIGGLRVLSNAQMLEYISTGIVEQVLLAIPSASRSRQIELVNQLEPFAVEVRILPSMADFVSGEVRLTDAREVGVDELLGREPVPPSPHLLAKNINRKVVMVTGAGGSIGSELCRQIARQGPSLLVLYEMSEFALYSIDQELAKAGVACEIVPVLGSVQNGVRVSAIMQRYGVQTVYHAAAYKHVPMVEFNITEGVLNNAFGTLATAQAALLNGVETFVLVSTDKAVRPTNVMGATKRMAELVLQALADAHKDKTRFCMVRFGNVLGSSGSVVPLFKRQLSAGGPITVTHPEITRYFMTIPEAAQLVIQAGAMGASGEVFVLDMGKPVKITDLARRLIHLSGHSIRDSGNPSGDIEIQFTGLRPGEKLYEELLIGGDVSGTSHPKIMKAREGFLAQPEMEEVLGRLAKACANSDFPEIIAILHQCVADFKPEKVIKDHLYECES